MEVKIKNQNELIDATIEMVDGIMVVSPKEVKFEPKDGECYYTLSFNGFGFEQNVYRWGKDDIDSKLYEMGWVFRTKQKCQEFCNRLNKAISQVKP